MGPRQRDDIVEIDIFNTTAAHGAEEIQLVKRLDRSKSNRREQCLPFVDASSRPLPLRRSPQVLRRVKL